MGSISPEEERELARSWLEERNFEARERLMLSAEPVCRGIARKLNRSDDQFEDLMQEGRMALMTAADRFDPGRGVRFPTYAAWWVRAAMQDFLASGRGGVMGLAGINRKMTTMLARAQISSRRSMEAEGVTPSQNEIIRRSAEIIGLKEASVRDYVLSRGPVSLDGCARHDGFAPVSLKDLLVSGDPAVDEAIAQVETGREISGKVAALMSVLDEREELIVRRRMDTENGRETFDDIAADLGLSRERVRQIFRKAMSKLNQAAMADDDRDSVINTLREMR